MTPNKQKQNGRRTVEEVGQHVDRAGEAAHTFVDEARASGQGLMDVANIRERVAQNPYGMAAAAVGIGYLLGGGLFTRTTGNLVRLGMKVAAIPLVRNELIALAETMVDGVLEKARAVNAADDDSPPSKE